nr:STAS-like domain-containing protein [uncultured Pedobacter sp.]
MNSNISISNYGLVISDQKIGDEILANIESMLLKSETVTVDFAHVKSMATFCAKQVFGYLYIKLTSEKFYERLIFKNVNEDLKLLIRIGIQNALEDQAK